MSGPGAKSSADAPLGRPARRLLEALCEDGAYAFEEAGEWIIARAHRGGASLRAGKANAACAQALLTRDLARLDLAPQRSGRARLRASEAGRAFLRRAEASADQAFLAQHVALERRVVEGESRLVDAQESPLAWLARRNLVDSACLEAGERLRRDLDMALMLPRVTTDWSAHLARGAQAMGAGLHASESAMAARQRVARALAAAGPDLAGLLIDVCGFLKGLETVEAERGWPRRSGKVALVIALGALARHYGLGAHAKGPAHGGLRHWGAQDYRPLIDGEAGKEV
jgi:hypothetical protein